MEERLKRFSKLVDAGSFTLAAKLQHTSQPALTTAVQKLERELKDELLIRGTRKFQLTPAGTIAYKAGQTLLEAEHSLQYQLNELRTMKQSLSLGCIDSIADVLVQTELLPLLENDAQLSITIQDSQALLQQLNTKQLDIAIIAEQPRISAQLSARRLGDEKFVLVYAAAQADAFADELKAKSLTQFLAYNVNSTTYALMQSELLNNNVTLTPRFHSTNPSILLGLARQGRGIAALPWLLVKDYLGTELAEVSLQKPLKRPIIAVWDERHSLPQSVEDFLDALEIQLLNVG